jgi:tetratricopeptide (TPR) repeat protein
VRINTAISVAQADRPREAAARLRAALAELDELEARRGPTPLLTSLRPTALLSLAETLTESGRLEEARAVYPRLLDLAAANGSQAVLAIAWHNLGKVEHRSGRPAEAEACFEKALGLHRAAGNLDGEGYSLWGLGELRRSTGDAAGAREAWTAARGIFEVLGQGAKTEVLRERLAALESAAALAEAVAAPVLEG